MYPPHLVAPMKEDLTSAGFQQLNDAAEVDAFMANAKGTSLVVVNSVCASVS